MADKSLKQLEKAKEILYTESQRASGDFSIPLREELLAKDPKQLTVREANWLRLYDTGISLDGKQIKDPLGAALQARFPYRKDTGGEAHKSSPTPDAINSLSPIDEDLKKAGFTEGLDTPVGRLSSEVKSKGFDSLGLSGSAGKNLRFMLNRTQNILVLSEKETLFLESLKANIKAGEAPRSQPHKLTAVPPAKEFFTRHARVIQNIKPSSKSFKDIYRANTQKAAVYLWGFTGERLGQYMSTTLYVPEQWAKKGGLNGFIEYVKGLGRAPGYINASNPTAIIPTQEVFGQAKGYKPIPLSPYLQAIMKDRIRKSLEALEKGIIPDASGSLAIKLFQAVDSDNSIDIAAALEKGKLKQEFADLVDDVILPDGNVRQGMGRDILPSDNRKIVPSLILLESGLPAKQVGQIVDSMHGKQTDALTFASDYIEKTSRERYLTSTLIGENKSNEVVAQIFLQEKQAQALDVDSLNKIPAKIGLGVIPELSDEGVLIFDITPRPAEEIAQNIPQEPKTISQADNVEIVKSAELSTAETDEAISASNVRKEENLTKAAEIRAARKAAQPPPLATETATTPVVTQTDELLSRGGIGTAGTPTDLVEFEDQTFESLDGKNKETALRLQAEANRTGNSTPLDDFLDQLDESAEKDRKLFDRVAKVGAKSILPGAIGTAFVLDAFKAEANPYVKRTKPDEAPTLAETLSSLKDIPWEITAKYAARLLEEFVSPFPTTQDVADIQKLERDPYYQKLQQAGKIMSSLGQRRGMPSDLSQKGLKDWALAQKDTATKSIQQMSDLGFTPEKITKAHPLSRMTEAGMENIRKTFSGTQEEGRFPPDVTEMTPEEQQSWVDSYAGYSGIN